jgi:hypothetical protein
VLTCAGVPVRRSVVAAVFAGLFAAGGASALPPPSVQEPFVGRAPIAPALLHARPADDVRAIRAGLARSVRTNRLSRKEAAEYRRIVARARGVLKLLPGSRGATLARVISQVRLHARMFNRPRALALFSMLRENAEWLATRPLPANETDVVGRDGTVYRVGWGYGLQFHPLANATALSAHIANGRRTQAAHLARALAARAVPRGSGRVLEYYFPYAGGRPPWTSGMAQAAAAQAFGRAAAGLGDAGLADAARRAFDSIANGLVIGLGAGPWIRHYSFSRLVVLNAHLQAIVSLGEYAQLLGDQRADALADRFAGSAKALLGRFDTGYWTRYSLGGPEARLNYHRFHAYLARRVADMTRDGFWDEAGARFSRYTYERPVVRAGPGGPLLYPWPVDGFRDRARISFWISKISAVTLFVGGRQRELGVRAGGWHAVVWSPGRRRPGTVRPLVRAVSLVGRRVRMPLTPIEIAVDTRPPEVTASVARKRLTWRARDEATPWLRMTARMQRAGKVVVRELGRRPLAGALRLPVPPGRWETLVVVSDSSGNRVRIPLGLVPAVTP